MNVNEFKTCIRRLEIKLNRCEAENVVLESQIPPPEPEQDLLRFELVNLNNTFVIYNNSTDDVYFSTAEVVYLPRDPDGYNFDGTYGFGGCINWEQSVGGVPTETKTGQSIYEELTLTGPDVDKIVIERQGVELVNGSVPLTKDFWIGSANSEQMTRITGNLADSGTGVFTKTTNDFLVYNFAANVLTGGQTIRADFYKLNGTVLLGTMTGFIADGNVHSIGITLAYQIYDRIDFYIHT